MLSLLANQKPYRWLDCRGGTYYRKNWWRLYWKSGKLAVSVGGGRGGALCMWKRIWWETGGQRAFLRRGAADTASCSTCLSVCVFVSYSSVPPLLGLGVTTIICPLWAAFGVLGRPVVCLLNRLVGSLLHPPPPSLFLTFLSCSGCSFSLAGGSFPGCDILLAFWEGFHLTHRGHEYSVVRELWVP